MEDRIAQILEAEPGKSGGHIDKLRDSVTGEYKYPLFSQQMLDYRDSFLALGKNESIPYVVAIIDSGLMHEHPLIKGKIIGEVDLVGEGAEDLNGHGTAVCLNFLMYKPDVKLLNVKAMDKNGMGTEKKLIAAFKWIVDWKKINVPKERMTINISAGVYMDKWWLFSCTGGCDLCKAADEAAEHNILIFAAAGNEVGKTACPANAKSVIPVASVKLDGMRLKNSGNAKIGSFGCMIYGKPNDYSQIEIDAIYRSLEENK